MTTLIDVDAGAVYWRREFLERAVGDGIERLDDYAPGWRERLRANRRPIRMMSPFHCVLSQLFGSYELGLTQLGIRPDRAFLFGFDVSGPHFPPDRRRGMAWEYLDWKWERVRDMPPAEE